MSLYFMIRSPYEFSGMRWGFLPDRQRSKSTSAMKRDAPLARTMSQIRRTVLRSKYDRTGELAHEPAVAGMGSSRPMWVVVEAARWESGRELVVASGNDDGFRGPGREQQGCSSFEGIAPGAGDREIGGTITGRIPGQHE